MEEYLFVLLRYYLRVIEVLQGVLETMEYLFVTLILFRSSEVLQEVEGMREYQENIENLNEVAHNRPRAHLVLGRVRKSSLTKTTEKKNNLSCILEVLFYFPVKKTANQSFTEPQKNRRHLKKNKRVT